MILYTGFLKFNYLQEVKTSDGRGTVRMALCRIENFEKLYLGSLHWDERAKTVHWETRGKNGLMILRSILLQND